MSKRAILRCDGSLEQGFHVSLEISDRHFPAFTGATGELPAAPDLVQLLERWRNAYYKSSGNSRIALESIHVQTGNLAQLEDCRALSKQFQQSLRSWLSSPLFQPIDQHLRETLRTTDVIEVMLRTRDTRLYELPWHAWSFIERYLQAEVIISSSPERLESPSRTRSKVRVLAILGDRQGIDTDVDRQILETMHDAEVCFLVEPSREVLHQQLWGNHWDILFFAGHSCTEEQQGRIHLNSHEHLTLEELKYGLRRAIANGLQLAIFNSCDGLGLAYELEQLHIPQLIVMREPVPDQVAQAFLKQFLQSFSAGESLSSSVRQAREWLQGLEGKFPCASWLPILFQNPAVEPLSWQQLLSSEISTVSAPEKVRRFTVRGALAVGLLVSGLIIGIRSLGWLEPAELWMYDRMMHQGISTPDPRLLAVVADDNDVKKYGDPLSDRTVNQVLQKIEQYQPKVIGLDILRDTPTGEGWKTLLKTLQQSDRIVASCIIGQTEGVVDPLLAVQPPPGVSSTKTAFVDTAMSDPDDVIRRYLLQTIEGDRSPCQSTTALATQVTQRYLDLKLIDRRPAGLLLSTPEKSVLLPTLSPSLGGYHHANDATVNHQMLVRYREGRIQTISIKQLFEGYDADLQKLIRDRIVLIGYAAADRDRYATPLGQRYGVWIHAQVVSQLLDFLDSKQTSIAPIVTIPDWLENFSIAFCILLIGGLATGLRIRWSWLVVPLGLIAIVGIGIVCFYFSIWLPIAALISGVALSGLLLYSVQIALNKQAVIPSGD